MADMKIFYVNLIIINLYSRKTVVLLLAEQDLWEKLSRPLMNQTKRLLRPLMMKGGLCNSLRSLSLETIYDLSSSNLNKNKPN